MVEKVCESGDGVCGLMRRVCWVCSNTCSSLVAWRVSGRARSVMEEAACAGRVGSGPVARVCPRAQEIALEVGPART